MLDAELVEFNCFALALGRLRVQLDRAVMSFDLVLMRCFRLGVGRVRRFFLDRLGPFPSRTPLNARVTGTLPGGRAYTLAEMLIVETIRQPQRASR